MSDECEWCGEHVAGEDEVMDEGYTYHRACFEEWKEEKVAQQEQQT